MVNGLGAFAGGLAQGLRVGQDMNLRQQYINEQKKADVRDGELHQAKMDEIALNKDKRGRLRAANDEIVAGWLDSSTQRPTPPVAPGLSDVSAPAPVAADTRAPGLSSLDNAASRPAMPSGEMIGKRMLTGRLLEDPDELTRMASIYKKHGLLDEMVPWMNQAYVAKKKRIPDALHFLLTGNAKGAREMLRNGGLNLADDPVLINPDDMQGPSWKFRFEDGREQDINLRDLAARFFPENYLDVSIKD